MNLLSSSVGSTDTCPFKHRNYFLAFVVNIVYFTCVLRARGHSMDDIVHVLDIQGEDSDRFVTCFVVILWCRILV